MEGGWGGGGAMIDGSKVEAMQRLSWSRSLELVPLSLLYVPLIGGLEWYGIMAAPPFLCGEYDTL
jgi:hypothetical protein